MEIRSTNETGNFRNVLFRGDEQELQNSGGSLSRKSSKFAVLPLKFRLLLRLTEISMNAQTIKVNASIFFRNSFHNVGIFFFEKENILWDAACQEKLLFFAKTTVMVLLQLLNDDWYAFDVNRVLR